MRFLTLLTAALLSLGLYLIKDTTKVVIKECSVKPLKIGCRKLNRRELIKVSYLIKTIGKANGLRCVVARNEKGSSLAIKCLYGDKSVNVINFLLAMDATSYDAIVNEFYADEKRLIIKASVKKCF